MFPYSLSVKNYFIINLTLLNYLKILIYYATLALGDLFPEESRTGKLGQSKRRKVYVQV